MLARETAHQLSSPPCQSAFLDARLSRIWMGRNFNLTKEAARVARPPPRFCSRAFGQKGGGACIDAWASRLLVLFVLAFLLSRRLLAEAFEGARAASCLLAQVRGLPRRRSPNLRLLLGANVDSRRHPAGVVVCAKQAVERFHCSTLDFVSALLCAPFLPARARPRQLWTCPGDAGRR